MRRQPEVEIRFLPQFVRPGDVLEVDARFFSKSPTPVDEIVLTLRGVEVSRWSDGKTHTRQEHHWVGLETRFLPERLDTGEHRYRARFPFPGRVPPSYQGVALSVQYTLDVKVDIPWWPDVDKQYAVTVMPPPAAAQASPWVFRSHEGEARGTDLYAECALSQVAVSPGGVLRGQLSLGNVSHHRVRAVTVSFVARETTYRPYARQHELARYTARVFEGSPGDQHALPFALRLAPDAPCSFAATLGHLEWALEVAVQHTLTERQLLSIPLTVLPLVGAEASVTSTPAVGKARRAQLWHGVGQRHGLVYDPEADTLFGSLDTVSIKVRAEMSAAEGPMTVATLGWAPLGLDLALRPGRWADVFAARHRLGVAAFDRAFLLRGRELAQLSGFLTPAVWEPLLSLDEVQVDDDGAKLSLRGAGIDEAALERFVVALRQFAAAVDRGRAQIAAPAALREAEAPWRAWARARGGRFEAGRVFVHGLGGTVSPCRAGHLWRDAETVDETVVVFEVDEALSEKLRLSSDVTGEPLRLDDESAAMLTRLRQGGARVELSAQGVAWSRPGATPEPEGLDEVVDTLNRLVRRLSGQASAAPFR